MVELILIYASNTTIQLVIIGLWVLGLVTCFILAAFGKIEDDDFLGIACFAPLGVVVSPFVLYMAGATKHGVAFDIFMCKLAAGFVIAAVGSIGWVVACGIGFIAGSVLHRVLGNPD